MISLLTLFISLNGVSNTFVGNGGDSTDLLLYATLNQVHKTVIRADASSFCTCDGGGDHPFCESLNRLNQQQVKYCQDVFEGARKELASLSHQDTKVRFQWTEESIKMGERSFEAVANFKENLVTIQKEAFLKMPESRRVALITHELLHLVDNGKLDDSSDYGPFIGPEGGRQLLDAIGASVAVASAGLHPSEKLSHLTKGSKLDRVHWIAAFITSSSYQPGLKPIAGLSNASFFEIEYQYHWRRWGGYIAWHSRKLEKRISSLLIKENSANASLGVTYKVLFKDEPASKNGQSHFLTKL